MKRVSSYAAMVWGAMFIAFTTTCALADRRVALVVGNAKYQKINPLENPLNDAPDIAEALRKIGFDVIIRTDTDKGGFDRALSEFARKAAGSDAALFYYAGHGIQYQKQNFLLPIDIEVEDYNDVEFQAVSVNRVMDALSRTNGVKIVILDSCRDNPLDKRLVTASRGTEGATRGLARVDRTEGLVIAYATAPDRVAQDGRGRNSPFTEALINRLSEPGLEVATLFRRVTQDVFERTNGQQRPEYTISLLNDYYLNLADSDSLVWARVRDSADRKDFIDFIQKYPSSPFAREAQFRLDLFDRIERENQDRSRLERERVALEREKELRDALERERRALAEERLAFERREAERREQERQDRERREAERVAIEKREQEKREQERLAAEKRDAERREQERLAAQKREQERLAADQREAARKEAERVAAEKRAEETRLAAAKREAEKKEAERIAAEREAARRDAERLAAEKKAEADRLAAQKRDAERLAAEKREAEKREADRLAAEKRVAERLAALAREAEQKEFERLSVEKRAEAEAARKAREQAEAERLAAEKREADRLAAEKREQDRLAAEQREAARRAAERFAAEKKAEAERLALEEQEARKREAERVAAEKKAEQERIRVAALQEAEAKKLREAAEKQRLADICARESEDVKRLTAAKDNAGLEAARRQAACPTIAIAIDKAVKDIVAEAKRVCDSEGKALAKIGAKDADGLRAALGSMTCEPVRKDATLRLAKLDEAARKIEVACATESDSITAAKGAGADALKQLEGLRKSLTCERLRPVVAEAITELAALAPKAAEIDTKRQILEAQAELKRLGCYTGVAHGRLNNGTSVAVSKYFARIESTAREARFTDEFIEELKKREAGLCPVAAPPANLARRPVVEEDDDEDEPVVRPNRRKPAERPSRVQQRPEREKPVARIQPTPAPRVTVRPVAAPAPRIAAPRPAAPAPRAPAPVAASRPSINVIGVGF